MAVLATSGEIIPIPSEAWRAKPSSIVNSSMWDVAIDDTQFIEQFRVRVMGKNIAARPIMALSELARILDAELPPPAPPKLSAEQASTGSSNSAQKAEAARWWTLGYATHAANAGRKAKREETVRLCREATGCTDAEAKKAFTALPGDLKNHDRSGRNDGA
jgi:ribosomal protein L7/L12